MGSGTANGFQIARTASATAPRIRPALRASFLVAPTMSERVSLTPLEAAVLRAMIRIRIAQNRQMYDVTQPEQFSELVQQTEILQTAHGKLGELIHPGDDDR